MASSARGSSTRLPEDQLKEKEKDGRIRRFIWDVLTLRILAYVFAQPASFTFIVSFIFITVSMPPMASYIRNADQLPDLDTMRVGTLHRCTNQYIPDCFRAGMRILVDCRVWDCAWVKPPRPSTSPLPLLMNK